MEVRMSLVLDQHQNLGGTCSGVRFDVSCGEFAATGGEEWANWARRWKTSIEPEVAVGRGASGPVRCDNARALSLFRGASRIVRGRLMVVFVVNSFGGGEAQRERHQTLLVDGNVECGMSDGSSAAREMKAANGGVLGAGATRSSGVSAAGHDVPVRRAAARSSTTTCCVERDA